MADRTDIAAGLRKLTAHNCELSIYDCMPYQVGYAVRLKWNIGSAEFGAEEFVPHCGNTRSLDEIVLDLVKKLPG